MKWVFLAVLMIVTIGLSSALRSNPRLARTTAFLIGLLAFSMAPLHLFVAPVSWAMWPGYVKGLEVSLLDAISLAVVLGVPPRARKVGMKIPLLILLAAATMSITQADLPMAAFFYAWQLARMFLVFCAVAILCRTEVNTAAVVKGLAVGITIQAVAGAYQSISGVVQAGGTFGHQNQLGMMSHFALFPALALLLGGRRGWETILAPLASATVVILTASRGTIGFAAMGVILLIALSIGRRPTGRKGAMVAACLAGMLIAVPLAMGTLDRRFQQADAPGDYDERAAFERAAKMMLADHPLGVGANEYVVVANTKGYSTKAGVVAVLGSRSANVHNAYLLAGAEMGYPGIIALVLVFLWPATVALRSAWRWRRDPDSELLVGCAVALLVVAAHSLYEWIFVTFHTQYLFAIVCGIISGVAYRGNGARLGRPRDRPTSSSPAQAAHVTSTAMWTAGER